MWLNGSDSRTWMDWLICLMQLTLRYYHLQKLTVIVFKRDVCVHFLVIVAAVIHQNVDQKMEKSMITIIYTDVLCIRAKFWQFKKSIQAYIVVVKHCKVKTAMQLAINTNFVGVFEPLPDLHNSLSKSGAVTIQTTDANDTNTINRFKSLVNCLQNVLKWSDKEKNGKV